MENSSQFLIRSVAEDASLIEVIKNLEARCWPKYMFYQPERGEGGEMSAWDRMFELFPAFQFAIFSSDGTDLLAAGNSVPLFLKVPLRIFLIPVGTGLSIALYQGQKTGSHRIISQRSVSVWIRPFEARG